MKIATIFFTLLLTIFFSGNLLFAKIVVESTKGEASYKAGNQWLPLTKGQQLQEGAKISTGVRSWALLNIDGNSVKVEQLTTMKIFKNQITPDAQNTHIGLKHGSLQARVSKIGKLKTSFKISTPVATSSVRGTEKHNFHGAKSGTTIKVLKETVAAENRKGVSNTLRGNLVFRLRPTDPRPQNLLNDSMNRSFTRLQDPNSTKDEKNGLEINGVNQLGGSSDVDNATSSQTGGPTKINININW